MRFTQGLNGSSGSSRHFVRAVGEPLVVPLHPAQLALVQQVQLNVASLLDPATSAQAHHPALLSRIVVQNGVVPRADSAAEKVEWDSTG